MATPGKKLDAATVKQIERLTDAGWSRRGVARQLRLAKKTVMKYLRERLKRLQSSPPRQ